MRSVLLVTHLIGQNVAAGLTVDLIGQVEPHQTNSHKLAGCGEAAVLPYNTSDCPNGPTITTIHQ